MLSRLSARILRSMSEPDDNATPPVLPSNPIQSPQQPGIGRHVFLFIVILMAGLFILGGWLISSFSEFADTMMAPPTDQYTEVTVRAGDSDKHIAVIDVYGIITSYGALGDNMVNRIKKQLEADDNATAPKKAGASNGSVDVPDDIREWSAHMSDLKKNTAILILEDGSPSEPIGASKLASFAEDVEGAQCLIVNSKISARMIEIAEVGAIPSVLGSASGVGGSDSVETYAMSDLE